MRTWNPLWVDPIDSGIPEDYKACLRRAIMASVNFMEENSFTPKYFKKTPKVEGAPPGPVLVIASWELVYRAIDTTTDRWFKAIEEASANGDPEAVPTAFMMGKAIACGEYIHRYGWDSFNEFMASKDHLHDNLRSH